MAAKTGTAVINERREVSWVIAFYTGMEEDRLVLVMVDGPADFGDTKFDVAKVLLN